MKKIRINQVKPKVSICVPIYNAEDFLPECLNSLVSQTLHDIEIICVDDGSTDNSPVILEKYAKKYHNIRIIRQKNQGLGAARNAGVAIAHGEYIGFVDADDFIEPTMYEILYKLAKKNKSEIVICNLIFEPNNDTKKHLWFKEYKGIVDGEFLDRNIQPWNKIVSKKLIDRINFKFYQKNGDDMFILLMLRAKNIVTVDDKLYHYRVGHDTMSNTFRVENFTNFVSCTDEQIKQAKEIGCYNKLRDYFDYRMIYVLIQTLAVAALRRDKATFLAYRKKLREYDYKKNKYVKTLLKKEFSRLEFVGMIDILPANYYLSTILLSVKLKGWR